MKHLRKTICLLLVLTVVLSSVSAFAYISVPETDIIKDIFRFDVGDFVASPTTTEIDSDYERIKFLDAVGVWDDVTKSKDLLVTMTEFFVIMSKVKLGSENAVLKVYEHNPDKTNVTYKDVIEYILHATGYYYRCAEFGNTPEALLIVAADIGLISDKPHNINSFITRGELSKYIEKALTIDMCVMEHTSSGGYKYTVSHGKNLLNTVHSIYDVSGFVNAVNGLAVYGGASVREGYIQIDRVNINTNGMELSNYFGTLVNAYVYYDETVNEYKIVYISLSEEHLSFEIDFKDIAKIDEYKLTYIDNEGLEQEFFIDGVTTIAENGKKLSSFAEMSDYKNNEGKIVFTSSSESSEYDTVIVYKYNYYVVDYNNGFEKKLGLKYNAKYNGNSFIQIKEKGINVVKINNNDAKYSDIVPNSTIRVFECPDTNYMEIVASTEKVTGEVTMLYDDLIEIGGKTYRISKDVYENIKATAENDSLTYSEKVTIPNIRDFITLYAVGNIVAGFESNDVYMFGFFKSASKTRTSIDPGLTLRIFTENSEWLDLELSEKLVLDGKKGVTKKQAINFIENNFSYGHHIGEELIKFKTNSNGEITALDTFYNSVEETELSDAIDYVGDVRFTVDWTKWTVEGSNYLLGPNAPIFVVPNDSSKEKEYKIVNSSFLADGGTYLLRFYNPDDFQQITAMVYRGSISNDSGDNATYVHVENIRNVIIDKEDDINGYKVMGKQYVNLRSKGNGVCQNVSFYIDEDVYEQQTLAGNNIEIGDFIRVVSVSNSNLKDWEILLKGGDFSSLPDGAITLGSYNGNTKHRYIGEIKKIDTVEMLVLVDCGADGMRTVSPRAKGVINLDDNTTTNASIRDFFVGDRVYMITGGPHADFMLKTIGGN